MYIEKVLDLWVQLMKDGGKNKSVAFIILFSVDMQISLLELDKLTHKHSHNMNINAHGCKNKWETSSFQH